MRSCTVGIVVYNLLVGCVELCRLAQGAEAPLSLQATLEASIRANQDDLVLGKGVSGGDDPRVKLPGTVENERFNTAKALAQARSAQISNQRNTPAVAVSFNAQAICSGVYIQGIDPLKVAAGLGCTDTSQCIPQLISDPASVGVPPASIPAGTVLMTLLPTCSCPFALALQGAVNASSFSPQDPYIATPVIAYSARFGCTVLLHDTEPPQKDPIVPAYTDDGAPPVVFDWPVAMKGSPGAFLNVDYDVISAQIGQFFEETAGPNISAGINASNTYAIGVIYKGRLIAEQYATSKGYSASTKLNSNSLFKSFYHNYMAGLRSADGAMSISDLAGAPHWGKEVIAQRNITVDNLLRMNAGCSPEGDYYIDTIMLTTQPDIAAYAAGIPLAYAPPGAVWDYSDVGYSLAALSIRNSFKGDNASYWSYPFNKLLKKIGCANATMGADSAGNILQTATGMYATLYDYAKMGALFLGEGSFNGQQILPKEWVRYSLTQTPGSNTPDGGAYGTSWWLHSFKTLPLYHYMAFGAFGQRVVIVPGKDLIMLHFGKAVPPFQDGYVWNNEVGTYLFANITNAIT